MKISANCAYISGLLRHFGFLISRRVFGSLTLYYIMIVFISHNAALLNSLGFLNGCEEYGMRA